MRTDERALTDIVEAADEIARFILGFDEQQFLNDPVIQRAVVYDLIVIGESANALSPELRQRYREVNWRGAIDMRNFAVHGFFVVTYERVWRTVTGVVPAFRGQIAAILETEIPEGGES